MQAAVVGDLGVRLLHLLRPLQSQLARAGGQEAWGRGALACQITCLAWRKGRMHFFCSSSVAISALRGLAFCLKSALPEEERKTRLVMLCLTWSVLLAGLSSQLELSVLVLARPPSPGQSVPVPRPKLGNACVQGLRGAAMKCRLALLLVVLTHAVAKVRPFTEGVQLSGSPQAWQQPVLPRAPRIAHMRLPATG